MIADSVEPGGWSKRRTGVTIALLMLAQTGLIYWLGRGGMPPLRAKPPGLRVAFPLAPGAIPVWGEDPALFALPNPHGFSGRVWARLPAPEYPATEWTEQARWLDPPVARLGDALRSFVLTNGLGALEVARRPEPRLEHPEIYPMLDLTPAQSLLRVEGDLASRALVSAPPLNSWPATNSVLTATEVQIAVDQDGRVLSASPITRSGSKEADSSALALARTVRFAAAPVVAAGETVSPVAKLTWGRLIFQWQTIAPVPATNAAAAAP